MRVKAYITLRDIDRATGLIESFIDELDYSGFAANDMAISAVERQFTSPLARP